MGLSGEIRLEGRLFNAINYDAINVSNEHYLMKLMRQTELDKVLPHPEGESNEVYLVRLQGALIDTLLLPELLAGYLLPAGKTESDWTPQMAQETTNFIRALTNREDRAEIQRLGMLVVFDFFREGLASLKRTENALAGLSPTRPPSPAEGTGDADAVH